MTQTDTEVIPKLCKVIYQRLHKLDMKVAFVEVRAPRRCGCPVVLEKIPTMFVNLHPILVPVSIPVSSQSPPRE